MAPYLATPLPATTTGLYARFAFEYQPAPEHNQLTLRLRVDDGFVAYLNGARIAAARAPESPLWNSPAAAANTNAPAEEAYDLSPFIDLLRPGTNVLAFHLLNAPAHPLVADLLLWPALDIDTYTPQGGDGAVVINEIHYDPDQRAELVEFVELLNVGTSRVDLSDWTLADAVEYRFPLRAFLDPGAYAVVAQHPPSLSNKYGAAALGPWTGLLDNDGERLALRNAAGKKIDEVEYRLGFPWPTCGDPPGPSMQLLHPALDNNLGGSWRSAPPTPGAPNAVLTPTNLVPPWIRQVSHSPRQPTSGAPVLISAKVTDPDGVANLTLHYQIVEPGAYLAITDALYNVNWLTMDLRDDGSNGDLGARDNVYSALLPPEVQTHRRLVRYRLSARDTRNNSVRVPYADDPQPNFAYFVYDGVPPWTGAAQPGVTAPVVFGTNVMRRLPVYHLLSKRADVENCTWIQRYTGMEYLWSGCLIYDGEVYDHIRYRARGGVWRYAMGKNMWKFDFNRGHAFQARDDHGAPYPVRWSKLNLGACIQQGNYLHRGEQGMFEATGFKLFRLAGCPASQTHWVQFRIVDEAGETGPTQFDGDFWGLYLAVEQVDGRFLDARGLPEGSIYKMEGGTGELNHQGRYQPTNKSDLVAFMDAYSATPPAAWWRANVAVDTYFGFRAVCEGIHNYDLGAKNYFYYAQPGAIVDWRATNVVWAIWPWDLDLTWANNMFDSGGGGREPFMQYGLWNHPDLLIARNNRIREFRDLLFNTNEAWRLIDDLAAVLRDAGGGPSILDADRALWDYHPVMTSAYVNVSKAGQGRFYQIAPTKDSTACCGS